MDAAGELAQLAQAGAELAQPAVEQRGRLGVVGHPRAGEPEREGERDEALLGTVVQVALDPAARGVARRDEAGARRLQLRVASAQLGIEPVVLERQRGRGPRGPHQLRLLAQRPVVHDGCQLRTPALDLGRRPVLPIARKLDRSPLGVDVAARIRQPVGERKLGIAERLGQGVAHARAAEPLHERADRAGAREA